MNLLIDGELQTLDLTPESNFGDVMKTVSALKTGAGIGLTTVCLNGEDITGSDWTRYASLAVAEIQALEVNTGKTATLAQELLESLDDFAGRLIGELNRIAELFRMGDLQKATELYSRALDGVQLLSHTTGMVERNLGVSPALIQFSGKPSPEHFRKLTPILDDLMTAQQKGDAVLLADLIEYELVPLFEDHQQILRLWREASRG